MAAASSFQVNSDHLEERFLIDVKHEPYINFCVPRAFHLQHHLIPVAAIVCKNNQMHQKPVRYYF